MSMVGLVTLDEVRRMFHGYIHEKELFGKIKHVFWAEQVGIDLPSVERPG